MKLRRSVAVVAGSVLLLSACGGEELPSKSEFISKLKQEMSSEMSSLESSGIDKAAAEKIFDEFLGCTYDEIKGDEELLNKVNDGADDAATTAEITKKATACATDLQQAAVEAATGGSAGG